MTSTLIKHARVVNEGQVIETDVRIEGQRISKIANEITATKHDMIVDAQGCYLLPGMIAWLAVFEECLRNSS